MPTAIAIYLFQAVFEFLALIGILGLITAILAAAWRLWRGIPLPPEDRRRPHFMKRTQPEEKVRLE